MPNTFFQALNFRPDSLPSNMHSETVIVRLDSSLELLQTGLIPQNITMWTSAPGFFTSQLSLWSPTDTQQHQLSKYYYLLSK